jgi:Acetyltransferases, including N-acetylases of ribosomal proteins
MSRELSIKILTTSDSAALSKILKTNSAAYQQYFYPFSFEEQSISLMLSKVEKDKYWGIWKEDELVGFFMLRGFDDRYEIPSYGVCIAESQLGKGLLKLSLQFVLSWCKLFNISCLMLKVHPENTKAKETYEKYGFINTGIDTNNNNLIYHYNF